MDALVVPADSGTLRRRPTDAIVAVVSALLLAVTATRTTSSGRFEVDLAHLLNGLPDAFSGTVSVLYRLGSLWFVALVAGVSLAGRRLRLAGTMAAAGIAAWLLGHLLFVIGGDRSAPSDIVVRVGRLQEYPAVRIAVAVAILSAGSPYLTVLTRRFAGAVLTFLVLGALYLGVGLPNDIAAGVLLGLLVGSLVKFVVGSPAGRPSVAQVQLALSEIGIDARELHASVKQPHGATLFEADDGTGGRLHVQAYGRDERDALLLSKMWRFVWYQESGPPPALTRLQQVEHGAYLLLRAASSGAPVPMLLAAERAGRGTAMLAMSWPEGQFAKELAPDALTDPILAAMWRALGALRRARICHGAIDLEHFVVAEDDVLITGFDVATTSASANNLDADTARLLAATAAVVGVDRAIDAALVTAGDKVVAAALPMIQAPVLTDQTRHTLRHQHKALDELRTKAAAAARVDVPEVAQLERVRPVNVATAAFTFLGIYLLLGQLASFADLRNVVGSANWGWFVVALAASAATNVGFAAAYIGATTVKLPFSSVLALQAAGGFTDLVTPNGVGTTAMNIRFLQVRGVPVATAMACSLVNTIASTVVNVGIFLALVPSAGTKFDIGEIPWRNLFGFALLAIAVLAIVGALLWRLPRVRRMYDEQVRPAIAGVREVARSPSKVTLVLAGNVLVALLYGLSLTACCRMYGVNVSFASVLVVNIGVSYIIGLIPVPGSLGVAEAGLSAGLAAIGVNPTIAVAAALTHRLLTGWLPPLPGWFALRYLQHEKDI